MAIGKLIGLAAKTAKAARAANKAKKAVPLNTSLRKAKGSVNKIMGAPARPKSLGTISRGGSRSGVESAGNIPRLQRSIRNARTTRDALTDAAAMAGVAGIVGGAIYGGGKTKKATPAVPSAKKKPSTLSRHTSKITKLDAGLKKVTPPTAKAKKSPTKKPVKKSARPTKSIPTTRNRRNMGMGPKTEIEVGSSVIRDRKGKIKKVTGPSEKTRSIIDSRKNKKHRFARMRSTDVMRLRGKERTAYKKWKASQGK